MEKDSRPCAIHILSALSVVLWASLISPECFAQNSTLKALKKTQSEAEAEELLSSLPEEDLDKLKPRQLKKVSPFSARAILRNRYHLTIREDGVDPIDVLLEDNKFTSSIPSFEGWKTTVQKEGAYAFFPTGLFLAYSGIAMGISSSINQFLVLNRTTPPPGLIEYSVNYTVQASLFVIWTSLGVSAWRAHRWFDYYYDKRSRVIGASGKLFNRKEIEAIRALVNACGGY